MNRQPITTTVSNTLPTDLKYFPHVASLTLKTKSTRMIILITVSKIMNIAESNILDLSTNDHTTSAVHASKNRM